jgi:hypothetical protein
MMDAFNGSEALTETEGDDETEKPRPSPS